MQHLINWFEIPTEDINRAADFYSKVLDIPVPVQDLGDLKMAFLPEGFGALVKHPSYTPSYQGPLIYLNGGDDLTQLLERVEPAGGKVLRAKTLVSPQFGFMALFEDTEGNRMALHSRN
ncbi:MAG: VOC family protein [Spirosomataceae bacterium]